jgi:hypothetical protein
MLVIGLGAWLMGFSLYYLVKSEIAAVHKTSATSAYIGPKASSVTSGETVFDTTEH